MNINNKSNIWLNNNATAGWCSTNIIVYSHIYTDCFSLTSAKAINLFNTNKCQILYVTYINLIKCFIQNELPGKVVQYLCKISIYFKTMHNVHVSFSIMLISHLKKVPVTDKCVKYFYASIQVYIVSVHVHIKTKVRHVHVHVLYIRSC